MPFEIPESWEWCRLSNLTVKEIKRGKSPTYISSSGVLVFAQKCNVKTGGIDMSLAKFLDEKTLGKYPTEEFMQDYDIVVNSTGTGTMGRIGLFRDSDNPGGLPIVPDSHVTIVRLNHSVSIDYLLCCLQYYQPYLEEHGEGSTNQKELKPDTIKNLYVPLPPILEQKRIADMVTGLEPYISAYGKKDAQLAELNKGFPEQLKKSILQLAVQGKLVPQDSADEPANVLLERIQAEKERLIKEGKIKKDKNESVIFRRDNSHYEKRNGKEECIDDQVPFDIPDSWSWCRLRTICHDMRYGTAKKSLKSGKVAVLRMGNIQGGEIDYTNLVYSDDPEDNSALLLQDKDLLFNRTNSRELVGKTGIYRSKVPAIYAGYLVLIRPIIADPEYINYVMNSQYEWAYCQNVRSDGINQANVSASKIGEFLVPIPPLNEQFRIVQMLVKLLPLTNYQT